MIRRRRSSRRRATATNNLNSVIYNFIIAAWDQSYETVTMESRPLKATPDQCFRHVKTRNNKTLIDDGLQNALKPNFVKANVDKRQKIANACCLKEKISSVI